ncbi:MAG: hypothetical protein KGJ13_09540 [Patescibacteria group bacterium]|nr:hypothetical protein [Patescibacteria group bacterium]
MAYLEEKQTQARALVGKRVEIPVHYDMWMRGARFGEVQSVGKDGAFVKVKLDHPQARKQLKVWRLDFDYMRVL